jgi:hypothetical protein
MNTTDHAHPQTSRPARPGALMCQSRDRSEPLSGIRGFKLAAGPLHHRLETPGLRGSRRVRAIIFRSRVRALRGSAVGSASNCGPLGRTRRPIPPHGERDATQTDYNRERDSFVCTEMQRAQNREIHNRRYSYRVEQHRQPRITEPEHGPPPYTWILAVKTRRVRSYSPQEPENKKNNHYGSDNAAADVHVILRRGVRS